MTDSPIVQVLMQRRPMTAADFGVAPGRSEPAVAGVPMTAEQLFDSWDGAPGRQQQPMTGAMLGYGAAPIGVGTMPPQRRQMTAEELMGYATQPGY